MRGLNSVLDDLTYVNLENEHPNTNPETLKMLKVMQLGLQYLTYSKKYLKDWTTQMYNSAAHEKQQNIILSHAYKRQKAKIRKMLKAIEKYDVRGSQYEVLADSLKIQIPKDFKNLEERKIHKEPSYLSKLKPEEVSQDKPDDELQDSDFELSMSLADRKSLPDAKQFKFSKEPEQSVSRFNNPYSLNTVDEEIQET